jgi:hypothetical protein
LKIEDKSRNNDNSVSCLIKDISSNSLEDIADKPKKTTPLQLKKFRRLFKQ